MDIVCSLPHLKLTVFHIQLLLQLSLSYYFFKSPLPHHHFTYNSHALALNSRVLLTKLKWEINQAYVSSEVQKSRLCTIKTNTFINTLCVHTCIWQYAKEIKKPDEPMYILFFPKIKKVFYFHNTLDVHMKKYKILHLRGPWATSLIWETTAMKKSALWGHIQNIWTM